MATAGGVTVRGELLVTRYGLEGGALYSLSQALHEMASPWVSIDFKPDSTLESLVRRLGTARSNFLSEARLRWRLDEPTHALLSSLLPAESFRSAETTAQSTKRFELTLSQARPVAEAISTAGGVAFSELTETLMLQQLPGVFVAGEMLDWEAPTGGYLMQGCFATGTRSGLGAAEWRLGLSP
jgi:predicted flavoprotein YhiN